MASAKNEGVSYGMDKAALLMAPHRDPALVISAVAAIIQKENPGMSLDKAVAAVTHLRSQVNDYNRGKNNLGRTVRCGT